MPSKVTQVVHVINIIYLDFVRLSLLKIVLDVEALDPVRRQVIHDDLRHSQLHPFCAIKLVQNCHAVRACERIHVRELLALERKTDRVDETALSRAYLLVDAGQHRIVKIVAPLDRLLGSTSVLVVPEARKRVSY